MARIRYPDFTAFMDKLVAALAGSAELAAFCQDRYGKPLTLVCGVDPAVGVEEDAYPVCSLSLNDDSFSNTAGALNVIALEVASAVREEGASTIGGMEVKGGIVQAHQLRRLIIEAVMNGGLGKVEASGGVDELVLDPLFVAYSNITITAR